MAARDPFLQNVKIVIVDDRPDLRLMAAQFLAGRGAQVFAAKNATEGFRIIREIHPAVVVSDINMPGRNGFELLADIRSLQPENGGRVPAIAMSAYTQDDEAIFEAGFQKYLHKPFTPDELLAAIDFVLQL